MIEAKYYLDTRRLDKEGRAQIRIRISKNGKAAMIGTGVSVLPDQWQENTIVNHPNKLLLNSIISSKLATANRLIIEKTLSGQFAGKSVNEIMELIKEGIDPEYAALIEKKRQKEDNERDSFLLFFGKCIEGIPNEGTRTLYMDTFRKVHNYCAETGTQPDALHFENITKDWLREFEAFCLKTQTQNTASRHLRDIRHIINLAIDEGRCINYPFRKFKIKKAESKDKSYSSDELRRLFNSTPYPGGEEEAVDIFKLMFLLIGINCIDLAYAKPIVRGRLQYIRKKTGKPYSIKIEPEAMAIIKKYAGQEYLLNIIEKAPNYKTYFNRLSKTLRKVGKKRQSGKKSFGTAILPDVCLGSARTSWATIAQEELDISRDVIAAALGHHTVDVTTTYLRTDWRKKIDDANRKVLDWVFYEKKETTIKNEDMRRSS